MKLNHAFAHLVGEYVRLRTNNLAYDTSECISIVCLNYIDSELYPRHFEVPTILNFTFHSCSIILVFSR